MSSNQPYPPDPRQRGYQQPPVNHSADYDPYANTIESPNVDGPYARREPQGYAGADTNYPGNRAYMEHRPEGEGGYPQGQYQGYANPGGSSPDHRPETYQDPNQKRANARYWVATVTYFILGVLEVILGLRLFFRLLGANMDNGFITFLYDLSHVFVGPFNGIFNDQAIGSRSVFELSTIIAMIIYALIAWGIVSLGRIIFAPVVPDGR